MARCATSYVKLPDNAVCVSSVLEEASARVGFPAEGLILLDSKFVPLSNDERGLNSALVMRNVLLLQLFWIQDTRL